MSATKAFNAAIKEKKAPKHVAKGKEWTGRNARIKRFLTVTARDDEDFQRLFNMADEQTPGKLPEGKMAVAIFLGEFTNGAHMAEIKNIKHGKDEIVVEFDDTANANDNKHGKGKGQPMMGATVMSAPVLIKLIDKSDKPVKFKPSGGMTPMGMLMRKRKGVTPHN